MNDIIEQFLSLPTVVLCLVIFCLVWVQRKGMELLVPAFTNKKSKWSKVYREFLCPLGPIGSGAVIGIFVKAYPYPEVFAESWQSRMFFATVCGLFSGLVYKIAKKTFMDKFGQKEQE